MYVRVLERKPVEHPFWGKNGGGSNAAKFCCWFSLGQPFLGWEAWLLERKPTRVAGRRGVGPKWDGRNLRPEGECLSERLGCPQFLAVAKWVPCLFGGFLLRLNPFWLYKAPSQYDQKEPKIMRTRNDSAIMYRLSTPPPIAWTSRFVRIATPPMPSSPCAPNIRQSGPLVGGLVLHHQTTTAYHQLEAETRAPSEQIGVFVISKMANWKCGICLLRF